ncbi:MAG: Dabb family protein [Eubacteriales bacterium]|nr:Dabb family protein [Eubacteriales bacterium]
MIKHIAIYFLKEKDREENLAILEKRLHRMEKEIPFAVAFYSGADCIRRMHRGVPGVPEIGDFAHVIDFRDEADVRKYSICPAHLSMVDDVAESLEKVVGIDIPY